MLLQLDTNVAENKLAAYNSTENVNAKIIGTKQESKQMYSQNP